MAVATERPTAEEIEREFSVERFTAAILAGGAALNGCSHMDARCKALAMTKLEEAAMWFERGIERHKARSEGQG